MVQLSIRGNSSTVTKTEVRKATRFFASSLMKPGLLAKIDLKIKFRSDIFDEAYVQPEDKTTYQLHISSSLGYTGTLQALAHEMTHVKQYATGIMLDYANPNYVKWAGKKIYFDGADMKSYWSAPWEIEARGYEICLYELYLREL
jgi:hypothetical protein